MEGLSARSVVINAFCQLVILLYLVDNETSYVVLFSSFLVRAHIGRRAGDSVPQGRGARATGRLSSLKHDGTCVCACAGHGH